MNVILTNLYKLQSLDLRGVATDPSLVAGLRASIPDGVLSVYDRARARGRKGIVIVRNHVCSNCRMQVPIAVTASLKAGMMEVCGNCGLYLCLPEPEEQPVAVATPTAKTKPTRKRKEGRTPKPVS